MTVTVLLENTTQNDALLSEHGLSMHVALDDCNILFDTGQTDAFLRNAETLGIDLSRVDIAVLSHGHYDHGGGISAFLEANAHAPVYLQTRAFGEYYNGSQRYIGLDPVLKRSERLVFCEDETVLRPGVTLYTRNGEERKHSLGTFGLTERIDGTLSPDAFLHEQYLLIEDGGKRVLFSGCSHKGILDIVSWFRPDVLIGGFHVSKVSDEGTLRTLAEALDRYDTVFYTCHCTGTEQFCVMKRYMRRLSYLSCGAQIRV